MNPFSVTVLISTYNRSAYLRECLEALTPQLQPDDEALVIDDGSTDDTQEVLKDFQPRVQVLAQSNRGKAAALNLGLARTSRPLVWIIDDDDLVCPDARASLIQPFYSDPSIDFAYGRYHRFSVDRQTGERCVYGTGHWPEIEPDGCLIATLEDMFIHQPGLMVRRDLYDAVGPFDETLARSIDYEMLVRLCLEGRGADTKGVIFLQRQHDGLRGGAGDPIIDRRSAWIANDQFIFTKKRDQIPLAFYLPKRSIADVFDRRRALLQRGVVYARKKLWALALEDFAAAAVSDAALRIEDHVILRRATWSKYGCEEFVENPALVGMIKQALSGSPVGRKMLRTLARSLGWRIRTTAPTNPALAFQLSRAALKLIG